MGQLDIFGDEGPMVTDVKMPAQAADRNRYLDLTCWDHCKHCAPEMLGNSRKVYRLCKTVGCKCYPSSKVCEWSDLFDHAKPVKPQSPGWEDF